MLQRFRRVWPFLTPPWLQAGDGSRVLFSLGKLIDTFVEHARRGLISRLPSMAADSANVLTAGDRNILRGRTEPRGHFVSRLAAWRTPRTNRVRGTAWEAIEQVWHYFAVHGSSASAADAQHRCSARVSTFDVRSQKWEKAAGGGDPSLSSSAWTWDWIGAGDPAKWARFWVRVSQDVTNGETLFAPQPDFNDAALWGGSLGNPGYTVGVLGLTPADALAMRELFQDRNWHPAASVPEWLVIAFNTSGGANPDPDGTWGRWGKDNGFGVRVAARSESYRYISLSPKINNTDRSGASAVAEFPLSARKVREGDGNYANTAAFATSVTLPSGRTYGGNRSSFPTNVVLIDDGSIPR